MAHLRATEWWNGRDEDPADYPDSAAAPVKLTPGHYVDYVIPQPYTPSTPPHHIPARGLPPPNYPHDRRREPYPPKGYAPVPIPGVHDPPPHEYLHERAEANRPRYYVHPPPTPPPHPLQVDPHMPIPGLRYPDGHFEPYPPIGRLHSAPPRPQGEEGKPPEDGKHHVEVQVPVCCEACEERIVTYLGETPGVDTVKCDVETQKVVVDGDLSPTDVLERCRQCFKKSTLL